MKHPFPILAAVLTGVLALWARPTNVRAQENQETYDHVVIVLDASGSMKQSMPGSNIPKMRAAKEALIAVLDHLTPTTRVGLLVFSARDLTDPWVQPLGPRDDARLIPAIQAIEPNRGTPLGQYLKIGADRLLEARAEAFGYGSYRLLVVTDGEANDGRKVNQYAPEILARGITMDVIGVAMNQDHTLAHLAHTYRRANDPDSLRQAISEVFAELGASRDDGGLEEAFDLLAPIPAETAAAALASLAQSGNEPIGGRPAARPRPEDNPAPPAPPSHSTPGRTNSGSRDSVFGSLLKLGAVAFIFMLVILKALFRKR